MFTAHLYGVFQSLVVASPARTVRWRLALVAFLAGITVSAPAALLLQFGWTRLFALITHQSLFDVVGVAAYSLDPFIEEIIKPLPLVLACMIPWVRRQLGITDIVIICLALGSGFGMAENLLRFSDVAGKAISTDNGVWIVPGGIFSAIAIPDIGKSLLSWIPEGAGNISILDMQDNMVVTNMHLAWSALAGLGIGIVLRQRQPWKWATLLLILLVSLDHAAYNTPETVASDNLNFKILTAFFGFLDKGMWLYPLVALGVAIWLDRRAIRAALRDVPAVYFPAERQGAFGLLEVARKLGSKPWSTIRLWSFVLQRRTFALHKALAPHEEPLRTMYNQLVATRIVLERNQPIAPPAFIAFFSRHGKSSAGMLKGWLLKKLTLQRAFLLLLSLPLILYFIIGSFPPFAWVQKLLENQAVFLFLMLLLGASVIWQIVRLALNIRQLPQVLKRFNGQIITIHFFSVLMAFGALLMAAGTVASFLQGNGPTDRAISSYHVLDAL
ncbi:MAG: PrsW family intramembrane metalloprotease, partial [Ktedonobacteraceae bacterium]|nr:PrsW family intramembrane metalloprotease [Ktedonobacteraceae bacterium]